MSTRWEKVINKMPNAYKELFYKTFNGEFKICDSCGEKYPKHKVFFRPVKYKGEIRYYTCRDCMENKKIEYYIKNGFKLHSLKIYFKEYLTGKRYCKQCDLFYDDTIENFTYNGICLCRRCEGVERLDSNYSENVKLKELGLKKCKYCNEIKSIDCFGYHSKKKGTRVSYCKDCEEIYKKEKSQYDKKYLQENKEHRKQYYILWKRNGGNEIRKLNELARRSKKKNLLSDLTVEQWNKILEYFNHSCAYCGMTEEEHKQKYNESLHQEHIIPMSQNGVFSDFNIIPSCKECNSKKNKMDLENYLYHNEKFTIDRYIKIIDYFLEVV